MNKKLLTAAVAAAMVAPAAMAGDVTIYGVAHVAMSYYDLDSNASGNSDKVWDLASHASRIGFKGSEDLGGGLSAIWQMEFQVSMADNNCTGTAAGTCVTDNAETLTMRNSFVGLAGGWGTFLMGRHDTPYKISTGSLDLFGDTIADYNGNGANGEPRRAGDRTLNLNFEDIRADNAVAYISPSFNGLTLAGAFVTAGGNDNVGGTIDLSDLMEAWSVAALYGNGPFYASVAYENIDEDTADYLAAARDKWRVGLGYTANAFHIGLVFESADGNDAAPGAFGMNGDVDRWQLSGSYTFGNNVVKAMYGQEDRKDATSNGDRDQWAIGVDHNFSKRTKAYLLYTSYDSDGINHDWDGYSLGLRHNF